jgi:hypothetical protein
LKVLQKVKKRAHRLDKGMNLCGLRVGWTFWIVCLPSCAFSIRADDVFRCVKGIIPGAGDVVDAILNYTLVVRPAKQAEIPDWLVKKMLANNGVSAAVGFIPLVGDILLGVWKANSRNAHLYVPSHSSSGMYLLTICWRFRLEEYLSIRGAEYLASIGYPVDSASPGHDLGVTQDPSVRSEYKPGAGLAPGEVIMPHEARKQNVTGRGWFNLGGKKGQQTGTTQVPVAAQGGAPRYGATSSAAERAL